VIAACVAWTEPTPWQARPYGQVDGPVVSTLETLLRRTDLTPEIRCRLLSALVSELAGEDDPRVAAAGEEAVALARASGDPLVLASGLATGIAGTHLDTRTDRHEECAVELARLADRVDLPPAFRWYATYARASVAGVRGDVPGLRARLAAAQEVAARYRMTEAEAIHRFGDAMLAHIAGRFDEAEHLYREGVDRIRRAGSLHAEAFLAVALCTLRLSQHRMGELEADLRVLTESHPDGLDALALALVAQGRYDEARACRRPRPLRPDYFFTVLATIRAAAVVALGERAEAPDLVEQLLPMRDQLPGALTVTVALRPIAYTLGELCRLVGREDEARAHFRHAETVALRWGAGHWADAARSAQARRR
jgi:hypothetical protein